MYGKFRECTNITMQNTVFKTSMFPCSSFIELRNGTMFLGDSVVFANVTCNVSIISLIGNSTIIVYGLLNMSNNHANSFISFSNSTNQYMIVKENIYINFNHNKVCMLFSIKPFHTYDNKPFPYPYCFFQYFSNRSLDDKIKQANFSITFHHNNDNLEKDCYTKIPITKCHWLIQSGFKDAIPLDPNK